MAAVPTRADVRPHEPALTGLAFHQHDNAMTDRLLYVRADSGSRSHILHIATYDSRPPATSGSARRDGPVQELTDRARPQLGRPSVPVSEKGPNRPTSPAGYGSSNPWCPGGEHRTMGS